MRNPFPCLQYALVSPYDLTHTFFDVRKCIGAVHEETFWVSKAMVECAFTKFWDIDYHNLNDAPFERAFSTFLIQCPFSDDNSFWLHYLGLIWPILLYILLSRCRLHLVWFEDEHSSFSSTSGNESTVFFNIKPPFMIEQYLHALFYNLADRD